MTLYPRRDVVHVAVSPRQGCGASHTRPVTRGVPDPNWALDCPPCESFLISDPQWSGTRAEIPETPDEVTEREGLEKRGVRDRETVIAAALAKIAGIADSQNGTTAAAVLCKRGHSNLPSSRFCGECGMPLAEELAPEPVVVMPAAVVEEEHVVIKRGKLLINPTADEIARLPVADLRELAKKRGIDPAQSKKSLVAALS